MKSIIKLFTDYLFGFGNVKTSHTGAWLHIDMEGKEFSIHHDSIDDYCEMLQKAKKKMEENL